MVSGGIPHNSTWEPLGKRLRTALGFRVQGLGFRIATIQTSRVEALPSPNKFPKILQGCTWRIRGLCKMSKKYPNWPCRLKQSAPSSKGILFAT